MTNSDDKPHVRLITFYTQQEKSIPCFATAATLPTNYKSLRGKMARFGPKWAEIWTQMEQMRDLFGSDFSTFWLGEPKCTEILFEKVPDLYYLGAI